METVVDPATQSYNQGHGNNGNLKLHVSIPMCCFIVQLKEVDYFLYVVCLQFFSLGQNNILYLCRTLNFISSSHLAYISLVPTMWAAPQRSVYMAMSHFLSPRSFIYTIHLNVRHRGEKDIIAVERNPWIKDQRAWVDFPSKHLLKLFLPSQVQM